MNYTRRGFINTALALAGGSYLPHYEALAAPETGRVKITAIKAMMLRHNGGDSLVKVETDAGLVGYGEAGATGAMVRARIDAMKGLLIGQDPLAIERHFHVMSTQMHTYMAHIPTVSGIDIALWDLAGKILGRPVSTLMGGPFRDRVRQYTDTGPKNMLDPVSCREWAQELRAHPMGWTTFKIGFPINRPGAERPLPMLTRSELLNIERSFANVREALGPQMDIAVHCHNEFDLPSAIGIARAVEQIGPLWLEDPMAVIYSDSWAALKRAARVPILTGEKLELPRQFYPFLKSQALDIVQPDLAYAGGLTGGRKIADLAALYNIPVCTHSVGTLVLTMASVHFGASINSFVASENVLASNPIGAKMASSNPSVVRNSHIEVPKTPGLGFGELDSDILRSDQAPGEPWWD